MIRKLCILTVVGGLIYTIIRPRHDTADILNAMMNSYSNTLKAAIGNTQPVIQNIWAIAGNGINDPYMLRDPGVY